MDKRGSDKCRFTNDGEWMHCNVCGGRIHDEGCHSRRVAGKDCIGQEKHTAQEMLTAYGGSLEEWVNAGHVNT